MRNESDARSKFKGSWPLDSAGAVASFREGHLRTSIDLQSQPGRPLPVDQKLFHFVISKTATPLANFQVFESSFAL